MRGHREVLEGENTKGHKDIMQGDEMVKCLDMKWLHMCINVSNGTFQFNVWFVVYKSHINKIV